MCCRYWVLWKGSTSKERELVWAAFLVSVTEACCLESIYVQ